MSSSPMHFEQFLNSFTLDSTDIQTFELEGTENSPGEAWKEPDYEGEIDYRIRQLSYSSLNTLHACPRKYELYKLRAQRPDHDQKTSVTFAFGHVIGQAIQDIFAGKTKENVTWNMFLMWEPDLFQEHEKAKKSFWYAMQAINQFISMREDGFLDEYELVYYNGKPATELGFCINFPDGFRLRGFVDAVLQHKDTRKITVLECKTTGFTVNPAMYKNSAQAIGYSIVLDHLFPDTSDYEVLYLIYETKSREYVTLPFPKTYLQRAQWIQELLFDIRNIEMYEEAGIYPMRGESCYNFGRECEYFQTCTLSNQYLVKKCAPDAEDKIVYDVNIQFTDLLQTQIDRSTPESEEHDERSSTHFCTTSINR